jgi:hypothetical protein
MKRSIKIIMLLAFGFQINSYAQQNEFTHENVYPGGITIDYGAGLFSVQDDFFSKERYSGIMPCFKAGWSRFHGNKAFQLNLKYGSSSKIRNNEMAADVVLFSLEWDYLYPAGTFSLFSKKVYTYLGPYADFYTYYNRLNFANDGMFFDFSVAALLSLGVHPMFIMPIREKLKFESSMQMNAFSVVIRMPEIIEVDSNGEDESRLKLLTPFSGLNSQVNFGIRYYPVKVLSLKLGYELHLTRITTWEYLLAANDNIIFSVTYHF